MKKISFLIILILIMSINTKVYAEVCYYSTSDGKVLIKYDTDGEFTIDKRGNSTPWGKGEPLINNIQKKGTQYKDSETDYTISTVDKKQCPQYIVHRRKVGFLGIESDGVFGFNNKQEAYDFASKSAKLNNMSAWGMDKVSKTEYEKKLNPSSGVTNSNANSDVNSNLGEGRVDCTIFGDKNEDGTLSHFLNEILEYPRYIVPIIVICLGTLDLCKAVIASKEDEMKKAQATFIKRCILGVTFYLIPVLLNLIFKLADIVWSGMYTTCGL